MPGSGRYKYCIVPKCKSSTFQTPEKVFINVPADRDIRKKWCHAMKRDEEKNTELSPTSVRYVCEDHFDLENDLQNYMQYKLQGGRLFLKKGVVPSIFNCQKTHISERHTGAKRRRMEIISDLMTCEPSSLDISANADSLEIENASMEVVPEVSSKPQVEVADKSVQVSLKPSFRSKAVNTVATIVKNTATSPIKSLGATMSYNTSSKQPTAIEDFSSESENESNHSSDESFVCSSQSDVDMSDPENFKLSMRNNFVLAMKSQPRLCLGIPKECMFVIPFLAAKTNCSELNVMITLKKIRLNDSYATLSLHFGMSVGNISRIFNETITLLAEVLQEFIFWPDAKKIWMQLPIAFRARYSQVNSLIDCFEIRIEKPTNPIHQALTWSEYKKCNTLKYLVSCTPDGLVNFLSVGYGGRATDTTIVEESGYLERLSPGMHIMADRGFKHISEHLDRRGCQLVRPPSVSENVQSTHDEVISAKQIAALRIHVERVIGRLREFNMLLPHVCIDHHLIQKFDNIVIIACGLINLQHPLIKK